jgi:E3 ubiquitin-protein ligase BRE1
MRGGIRYALCAPCYCRARLTAHYIVDGRSQDICQRTFLPYNFERYALLLPSTPSSLHSSCLPNTCVDPASVTSALHFKDSQKFQDHLGSRAEHIKSTISILYSKLPTASPDTTALQNRVNELLAAEKVHIAELQQVTSEKEQLAERLENATYRYILAERKLDRSKSQAVANLEAQGMMQSNALKTEQIDGNTNGNTANGTTADNKIASEAAERDRMEALAVAEKAKEQLSKLEEDNLKLTREVTALKSRLDSLSDEDYANTELFKVVKSQLEDSYNKLNDLEATHIQLREEAKKAQAERTSYRMKIDEESHAAIAEAESQLARADADLQRIRAARDDLTARNSILEASQADRQTAVEQTKALSKAHEDRINALEAETERLKIQCGEIKVEVSEEELELSDVDDLRAKVANLKKEYSLLSNELPSMEQAWKKAQNLASNKVAQAAQWEDQLQKLNAEKAKADQKYFGAMKAKEAQEGELRSLRKQNKASSGIIASLKETESKIHELCTNLDKQLAEDRATIGAMVREQQLLDQKATQASIAESGLRSQVTKLKESLSEKDSSLSTAEHSKREAEQEVEALKIKLQSAQKSTQEWKVKAESNSSVEVNDLRVSSASILTEVFN